MSHPLDANSLMRSPDARRFATAVFHFPSLESTNDKALELLEEGKPEGTLVVADEQTRGRGRRERRWESPPHLGIYASLILRPKLPPGQLTLVSLAMGVGACKALRQVGLSGAGVKWPNDLLVEGRKLGGILCEARGEGGREGVVVGLGLNVNQDAIDFPLSLRETATSLKREAGREWDRTLILGEILACCAQEYDGLQANGPEGVRQGFEALSVFRRGDRLRIDGAAGAMDGDFAGLGNSGELLLDLGGGALRAFHFGEVVRVSEE